MNAVNPPTASDHAGDSTAPATPDDLDGPDETEDSGAPAPASHIAVFAFPEFGHVNPLLGVVRRLVRHGHKVTWLTGARYGDLIRETGADFVGFDSARLAFSSGKTASAADLGELGLAYLTESIDVVMPLAAEVFAGGLPDLVLYDFESALTVRTLLQRWDRPGVQVFPCVASNEEFSLHAEVFSGDDEAVRLTFELLERFLADTGQDPGRIWDYMTPYDTRNLVMLPQALQPHGETFDERYTFIGHGLEPDRPAAATWSRPAAAESVALISLGTEADNAEFFHACVKAFGGGTRHLVMTLGAGRSLEGPDPLPDNVEVHAWLPHTVVLPDTEVFVTHGGVGSIVESLYFGVPMVVVPHTAENTVNARRIAELGLGLWLPETDLTAEALKEAVEKVAADPAMRANAARMRKSVIDSGGAARAVSVLEGYLARDREAAGVR